MDQIKLNHLKEQGYAVCYGAAMSETELLYVMYDVNGVVYREYHNSTVELGTSGDVAALERFKELRNEGVRR